MSDRFTLRQELASAVLLGHASQDQIDEFETLFDTDPAFRRLVGEMEAFLAPLSELSPDAEPPEGLLDEIMQEIDGPAASPVEAAPNPASTGAVVHRHRPERPWQMATAAAAAIAIGSLALHMVPATDPAGSEPPPQQSAAVAEELLALMTSGDQAPNVVVLLYDKDSNKITGRLTNTAPPTDGVWQLWLLREGIDAPQSLGLLSELSEDGVIDLSIATELAAGSDTLAISLEPDGGSPEPGPTGPIVFTGAVNPI